ncbi:hypothetical protein HU200_003528 [Digitaria exilis]|uniref:Glucose/Sorbosone dehydrogenase domain-containing protein n=1 Tax=Digitaria exilis TaxID=1010633 RepID=A0A835KVV0_9POAL|nr:hypothetical protein HU200_003528 [Digitaria exilis]
MAGSSWVPLHCGSTTPSSEQPQQETMCLEMVAAGSYQTMVAHPDGSGRLFLATRDGRVLLASQGSGAALRLHDDGARPFLDLAGRVHHDADLGLGLMGIAFHREFATSGRFFVSYTCESASPTCGSAGTCSAGAGNNGLPCLYQLVVAEFCAEGEPGDYSMATHAYPSEVRRVFTMGLPSSYQQNGGQILFPPMDADSYYLHLIVGHGGGVRDLSKGPYYGKIVRFDVDSSSTPNTEQLEIVAMGLALSSPRGCSFDSQRPSDLYCANVDEVYDNTYTRSKAGKHGGSSADEAAGSIIISHGRRPADAVAPSMVGGLVYRGSADPSLVGRYLYIYGSVALAAMETPGSGGLYSSSPIPDIKCSRRTPLPCPGGDGIGVGGRVLSWGEDNGNEAFVLATDGVVPSRRA